MCFAFQDFLKWYMVRVSNFRIRPKPIPPQRPISTGKAKAKPRLFPPGGFRD
jgi:hypothetical protein